MTRMTNNRQVLLPGMGISSARDVPNSNDLGFGADASGFTPVAPTITSSAPANPVYGVAYSHQYTATGTTPITWSVTDGDLPDGLSLDADTGVLSGTPTASGAFTFTVQAENSVGTDTQEATFTIYLLRDEFITADAAPVASPRTCEPGPGEWALTQTDGEMSIEYGLLSIPAQSTAAHGDQGGIASPTTVTRRAGRVFMLRLIPTATGKRFYIFWGNGTGVNFNQQVDTNSLFIWDNIYIVASSGSGPAVGAALTANNEYRLAIVQRENGYDYFIRGGVYTVWTRVWIETTGNTATLYPTFGNYDTAGTLKGAIVKDLGGVFQSDDNAFLSVANPTAASDHVGLADGIFELTVTAPGSLTGTAADISYRRVDASNFWQAYIFSDGKLYLDSIVSGSRTNRTVSGAAVVAAGQTVTIRVIVQGTKHSIYRKLHSTGVWVRAGSEVDVETATLDAQTGVRVNYSAGYSASLLRIWERTSADFDALDSGFVRFMPYGDSKTAVSTYPQYLEALLSTSSITGEEAPKRIADNGKRVSTLLETIDTDLAKVTDPPDYVLSNLGINDIGNNEFNDEEARDLWVTRYQEIIDAFHAKWPDAKVGIMRIWGRNYPHLDLMDDTYIPQVIAGRDWAYLGPDERVFLENGDNGATYTSDGVHPNEAGRELTAQQWYAWIQSVS